MGHGSRSATANEAMERVAADIRRRSGLPVYTGFMEFSAPRIEDVITQCARQKIERLMMIPYFLHTGQHVLFDLPEKVSAAERLYPDMKLILGPPIGYHPAMADILLERIAEAVGGMSAKPGKGSPAAIASSDQPASSTRLPAVEAGKRIEAQSFDLIEKEIGPHHFEPEEFAVVRRVIHATADFDFARSLKFQAGAVPAGLDAIHSGLPIVTDVEMVRAGVLRRCADPFGVEVNCYLARPEINAMAALAGTTRSVQAMRIAARTGEIGILAVGNAPTALLEAIRLADSGEMRVRLIVGVPVGFVSAAESKEALLDLNVPAIATRGRKGGSTVAAAIVNALLFLALEKKG